MFIDDLIIWLESNVEINNRTYIKNYLSLFSDLIELIPIAVSVAKKHFPEAHIVIDLYEDPEIDDSYIVLYIRLSHYDNSFIEQLAAAESEMLPLLVNKKGWIQFSTDFLRVK